MYFKKLCNTRQRIDKILATIRKQHKVIGITNITTHANAIFNEVIQLVQIDVRE
mgnify:CR=1 FL=1